MVRYAEQSGRVIIPSTSAALQTRGRILKRGTVVALGRGMSWACPKCKKRRQEQEEKYKSDLAAASTGGVHGVEMPDRMIAPLMPDGVINAAIADGAICETCRGTGIVRRELPQLCTPDGTPIRPIQIGDHVYYTVTGEVAIKNADIYDAKITFVSYDVLLGVDDPEGFGTTSMA